MIKLFLALNTSKNNTYSGFKKEMTEEGHAYREHRDQNRSSAFVSACLEARHASARDPAPDRNA